MALADIEARASAKFAKKDPRRRAKRDAAAEKARRISDLKADGIVLPLSEWLGHNNGPSWDEFGLYLEYCWAKAQEKAWRPPSIEVAVRRARKAQSLGLTYRQYTLEIMERGRYLDEKSAAELRRRWKAKCWPR